MNKKERREIAFDLEHCWYYKPINEEDKARIQKLFEKTIERLYK
jgi:hypothetical protein